MNKKISANLALFLTALIWGVSFVAQKAGMDYVGAFSFNFARSILGGLSLIPLIFLIKITTSDKRTGEAKHIEHIRLLQSGFCCGLALFIAMSLQQYSMISASAGKAGFISALYIIFVPLISVFFGAKLNNKVKISVGLALIGLYFLCFKSGASGFDLYDGLLLVGAFFYGVHILVVNYFSKSVNPVKLSCSQFFVVALLSLPFMFLFETPDLASFISARVPILYAGILTCGVAYTLQIFGQKYTPPTIASIILCMESVFAVIGGSVILHETMSLREICGCILMIAAVVLSQIHSKSLKKGMPAIEK